MSAGEAVVFPVRGILFDMDGVLMSSLGSVERSWRTFARARGVDPELAVGMAHGRRALETVQALLPDADHALEVRAIEDLEVADNEGIVVLPGVRRLLESLPPNAWAIVTSATERLARSRLAFAGLTVPDFFVTADMVARGKPDPEPYRRGAEMLRASPRDCLVIEDAPAGVTAGRAAGCQVLGVLTTHSAAALAGADWRVRTLEDVSATQSGDAPLEIYLRPVG